MLRLSLILALGLTSWCAANDWPQFRGPDSDGHVRHAQTPLRWSDTEDAGTEDAGTENVVWKVPVPGLGWSSPVVVADRIYLTTAVPQGEGLSLRTMALDTQTGRVIWDREIRSLEKVPAVHAKNSHASPTPIVSDGSVYVHFGTFGTARLSAADGTIEWLCTELVYTPMHGSGGSPVLRDGKLVIVCDGSADPFVVALDASSGKILWKTLRDIKARVNHSFVTPLVADIDGQLQVLAPGPDHFAAYDLQTGHELWRVKAPGWSVVPQPTLFDGLVIYNHDYDNPELMAVRLGGHGDVTDTHVAWRRDRGAPSTPTPLLVDGLLYTVSDKGIASCLDARTGQQHWLERLGGNFSASPVYANGHVLLLSEDGVATWIRPGTQFHVVQKNEIDGRTLATPAFAGNAMYLRTDESLYKIADTDH